ncbi:MAG: hypothetical protein KBC34_01005 [Phenylobacterium sp.]|nr:hypothetical protein [Phenylobacterium sp.]
MRAPLKQIRKAAERFIETQDQVHAPAELPQLLHTTALHLAGRFGLTHDDAYDVALGAWSEIEGKRSRCYVDLDMSTPHLVFLVDPVAGMRRPIPVVDLVRLLGPRQVSTSATPAAIA